MIWLIKSIEGIYQEIIKLMQLILLIVNKILYYFAMKYTATTLPQDQKQLQEIVLEQQNIIEQIRQQYENLQHQVQCLLRNQYGKKSEQGIPGQGNLFDAIENNQNAQSSNKIDEDIGPITYTRKKPRVGQRQFPSHLPRKRIEYDIPEEQKICSCGCGQVLKRIGEEILEQLEEVPAQLYVIEHVRFKYAGCRNEPTIITAAMPRQPIDKSIAGPGLLATTIIKKYDDHIPLYRQSEIWERHKIDISRSTLCDWIHACGIQLKPLIEEMKKVVLSSPKIHTDDTPVPVLKPGSKKTKTGRLWVYLGGGNKAPPCAVYEYTPTRQQIWAMEFLKGYRGYLHADAYQGYDILFNKNHKDYAIIEVACMAHVRRKFYEIAQQSKETGSAHEALLFIKQLYQVETEVKELDNEIRKTIRQEKAKPILNEFKEWLDKLINRVLPKSPLGNAVNYALKNWTALIEYLEDGILEIDNNAAERLIKPIKIGVKNYLFAGSDQGGINAALFYSLIETCKLNKINPYDYLRDVLIRLPTQLNSKLNELLPWNWKSSEINSQDIKN